MTTMIKATTRMTEIERYKTKSMHLCICATSCKRKYKASMRRRLISNSFGFRKTYLATCKMSRTSSRWVRWTTSMEMHRDQFSMTVLLLTKVKSAQAKSLVFRFSKWTVFKQLRRRRYIILEIKDFRYAIKLFMRIRMRKVRMMIRRIMTGRRSSQTAIKLREIAVATTSRKLKASTKELSHHKSQLIRARHTIWHPNKYLIK